MFLVRMLYCSIPNGVGDECIKDILDRSRTNNAIDNITGALVYNGGHFLQCLEGSRYAVTRRFIAIANDKRHKDIELLSFSPIPERRFPGWTMGYVGRTDIDHEIISRYTTGEFDPRRMIDSDALIDMMWKLAQ